jgi:hypothetical protein
MPASHHRCGGDEAFTFTATCHCQPVNSAGTWDWPPIEPTAGACRLARAVPRTQFGSAGALARRARIGYATLATSGACPSASAAWSNSLSETRLKAAPVVDTSVGLLVVGAVDQPERPVEVADNAEPREGLDALRPADERHLQRPVQHAVRVADGARGSRQQLWHTAAHDGWRRQGIGYSWQCLRNHDWGS